MPFGMLTELWLQACWGYLSYSRKLAAAEERSSADGANADILRRVGAVGVGWGTSEFISGVLYLFVSFVQPPR